MRVGLARLVRFSLEVDQSFLDPDLSLQLRVLMQQLLDAPVLGILRRPAAGLLRL